jgi:hypothetical protein
LNAPSSSRYLMKWTELFAKSAKKYTEENTIRALITFNDSEVVGRFD